MKRVVAIALLVLSGCATDWDATPALMGTWGGKHIELVVGTLDSAVEFDCAEGMIFGPYSVDRRGDFSWIGTYTRGTGGPERIGEVRPSVSAVYSGVLRGPEMTMRIQLDDGQTLGPFELKRFQEPQLTRCL